MTSPQRHGLLVAGSAVILTGDWLEVARRAVMLAERARHQKGLSDNDTRQLAAALRQALSGSPATDGPKPGGAHTNSRWLTTREVAEMMGCGERHAPTPGAHAGRCPLSGSLAHPADRGTRTPGKTAIVAYAFTAGPMPAMTGGTNTFHREGFSAHIAAVGTLESAGIAAPEAWTALKNRFADFLDAGNPSADRLASEIVKPTGADIIALRNLAIIEEQTNSEADASVNARVRSAVRAAMVNGYAPVALKNR